MDFAQSVKFSAVKICVWTKTSTISPKLCCNSISSKVHKQPLLAADSFSLLFSPDESKTKKCV